jgi:hypothetical protein
MKPGRLFVSFWNLCLENIPEGGVVARRRVSAAEAKALIEQARRDGSLLCVTADDLLAPYKKRECEKHNDLCRALGERFGIELSLKDFANRQEIDGGPSIVINPLDFAEVEGSNRLMVVTCSFALAKETPERLLAFDVAPDTIEFHLFEARAAAQSTGAALIEAMQASPHREVETEPERVRLPAHDVEDLS